MLRTTLGHKDGVQQEERAMIGDTLHVQEAPNSLLYKLKHN
jgi:hypothetical protein